MADFKSAYGFIKDSNKTIVSTWTPAALWYSSCPDYAIKYSISGSGNEWWMYLDSTDVFCNATLINEPKDLPKEFLIIIDEQAKMKIGQEYTIYLMLNCEKIFSAYNIEISECKT